MSFSKQPEMHIRTHTTIDTFIDISILSQKKNPCSPLTMERTHTCVSPACPQYQNTHLSTYTRHHIVIISAHCRLSCGQIVHKQSAEVQRILIIATRETTRTMGMIPVVLDVASPSLSSQPRQPVSAKYIHTMVPYIGRSIDR